jgi:hypothetical protein
VEFSSEELPISQFISGGRLSVLNSESCLLSSLSFDSTIYISFLGLPLLCELPRRSQPGLYGWRELDPELKEIRCGKWEGNCGLCKTSIIGRTISQGFPILE